MPLILNKALYFLTDFKYYLLLLFFSTVIGLLILILIRKRWLLLLLATSYSLFAIFAFSEIYFRYIYDQSDGLGFLKINQKWHQRHVIFNSDFKRDRNFTADKQPGEFRIGVLGDSITFGGGIEKVEDRFSNLLETKLRTDGFSVSVYNLGVSGTGSEDQIKNFADFKHLNFDLLIWQYFLNDINPPEGGEGSQIIITNKNKFVPPSLINWLTDHSYFADWLYWRLSTKYNRTFTELAVADLNAYQDEKLLERHQTAMTNFLHQARREKLPIVVILFPFIYQTTLTHESDQIYDQMLSFFRNQEVSEVIDLKSTFRLYPARQLIASRFDSHPNELAHAITADRLYQAVRLMLQPKI